MKPDDMDRIIEQAAGRIAAHEEDSRVVESVESVLLKDLRPVRPLAPVWSFSALLVGLFAFLAILSGSILGLHGIRVLSPSQIAWIFSALLGTGMMAAIASAREMRPASGVRFGYFVPIIANALFLIVFAALLTGYGMQNFVAEGIPCLVAGLSVSLPTAVAIALILRRGFILDWKKAGTVAGTLAGLAGLGMLELHCANLKAIHVIAWHVAVVVMSGSAGFAFGWTVDRFRSRKAL
jgi:Negative regulator of sigma F